MIFINRYYRIVKRNLNTIRLLDYLLNELAYDQNDPYNQHQSKNILDLNYIYIMSIMWQRGYVFSFFNDMNSTCLHELVALKLVAVKKCYKWIDVPCPESIYVCYLTPIGFAYIRTIGLDKLLNNIFDKPNSYKPPMISPPDKATRPKLSKFEVHYGTFEWIVSILEAITFLTLLLLSKNILYFFTTLFASGFIAIISGLILWLYDQRPKLRKWKANYPYPVYASQDSPSDSNPSLKHILEQQDHLVFDEFLVDSLKTFESKRANLTKIHLLKLLYDSNVFRDIPDADRVILVFNNHMFVDINSVDIEMWYPFMID